MGANSFTEMVSDGLSSEENLNRLARELGGTLASRERQDVHLFQRALADADVDQRAAEVRLAARLLNEVLHAFIRAREAAEEEENAQVEITRSVWGCVLRALAGGDLMSKDIAVAAGKRPDVVSRALTELKELRLVETLAVPEGGDKRHRVYGLTAKGRLRFEERVLPRPVVDGIELACELFSRLQHEGSILAAEFDAFVEKQFGETYDPALVREHIVRIGKAKHALACFEPSTILAPEDNVGQELLNAAEDDDVPAAVQEIATTCERGKRHLVIRCQKNRDTFSGFARKLKKVDVHVLSRAEIGLKLFEPMEPEKWVVLYESEHLLMRDAAERPEMLSGEVYVLHDKTEPRADGPSVAAKVCAVDIHSCAQTAWRPPLAGAFA